MTLKELDVVRLNDGRLATIVFLPAEEQGLDTLEVELERPEEGAATISIHRSQITAVVYRLP